MRTLAQAAILSPDVGHDPLVQTLREVVQALDSLDDEGTIFTDGTSPAARAAVVGAASGEPESPGGLRYFLEVALAKEAVAVWREWRGSAQPTTEDKLMAISYYATHDAYLPVE